MLFDGTLTLVVVRMAGLRGWQTSCRLGSRQFVLALRQPSGCRWCQNLRPPVYRHNKRSGPCNLPRFDRQPHLIRKREKNDRLLPPNCPRLVFRTATSLGDFNGTLQGPSTVLVRAGVSTQFKSFPPIWAFAVVMKLVANHVTVVGLADTAHCVMEERPKEMMDALVTFL